MTARFIDSSADIAAAANRTMESMGYARRGIDKIKADIGWGVKTLLERLMPDEPPERIEAGRRMFLTSTALISSLTRMYTPACKRRLPFQVARQEDGCRNEQPVAFCGARIDRIQSARIFLAVIGGDSFVNRKPHPEPIEAALKAPGRRS